MWFSKSEPYEKNVLYEATFSVTGSAVNDGFLFEFAQPIYLRNIKANAECYYYHDSSNIMTVSNFGLGFTISNNSFPLKSATGTGTAPISSWSVGGSGGIKRLSAPDFAFKYENEPLRIRFLGIWRISSNITCTIAYFL